MITAWLQKRTSDCPRIGLDVLDATAALQHRIDTKYVVPQAKLVRVLEVLLVGQSLLEIDDVTAFRYRSTYLDTPDLASFHAHRQGRRLRWKARTRVYADSGRTRLEVKLKDGRGATDKHATLLPAPVVGVPAEAVTFLAAILSSRYGITAPAVLVPTLLVTHRRFTLADPARSTRLTIDTDLRMASVGGTACLRPENALIETKSSHGRSRADLALHRAGVRPVAVSKYCAGMALTHPTLPDQPWLPVLRQFRASAAEDRAAA